MTDRLGTIGNSRTDAQRDLMERTVGQGVCPLCELDREVNHPFWEEDYQYWRVWASPYPYPYHGFHFVIALRRHEIIYENLMPEEVLEKFEIERRLIREFNLPGGGLVTRFGDPEYNAGTLTHIHAHVQVPDQKGFVIAVFYKDSRLTEFLTEN